MPFIDKDPDAKNFNYTLDSSSEELTAPVDKLYDETSLNHAQVHKKGLKLILMNLIMFRDLFKAVLAEFALHLPPFVYLGKMNASPDLIGAESACVAPHNEAPTRGTLRSLARVLRLRHPLGLLIMCGIGPSRTTSLRSSPQLQQGEHLCHLR